MVNSCKQLAQRLTRRDVHHTVSRALGAILLMLSGGASSLAGGGPENVFLLVNSASRGSLAVANHYIDLRKIPPSNVYYTDYRRSKVVAQGRIFRDEILSPAVAEIKRRGLSSQIDYMVYSSDFPWRIDFTKDFPGQTFPRPLRPVASLTGATYLASFVVGKRKEIVGLKTNFYASVANARVTISQGFRAQYRWDPGGKRAATNGLRYYLSAMLGVTNGRGNSLNEIVNYLRRAARADGTNPGGTIHFVKNNSPRSTPRHDGYDSAMREIRVAGVQTQLLQGKFLKGERRVMGLTSGWAQLEVQKSGCKYLPGAFCDNLTSAGGNFVIPKKLPGQTCLSEFLRAGAAGANGTVIEPFGIAQKFPSAALHVHYVHGCSLAEAFYQSVHGPYQQILVGDPLCQPWAKIPLVSVDGLPDGDSLRGSVEITPSATNASTHGIKLFELYVDGKRTQQCRPGEKITLETSSMDDGQHELRVVATDASPIETQGRWIGKVIVKNGRDATALSVNRASLKKGMKQLAVNVTSTHSRRVSIYHNGRELGHVAEGSGTLEIGMDKLGIGPVTLIGKTVGSSAVRSHALRIVIP